MLTCSPSSVDVKGAMDSYVGWVGRTHSASDSLVDSRVEAKFLLPDATPFSGPWCRPQNDGPGLRAITLISYANQLLDEGNEVRARAPRAAAGGSQKRAEVLATCGRASSATRQTSSLQGRAWPPSVGLAGVQPAA